jgi:fumarate hydratase class II
MLITALVPQLGYDRAAEIVNYAHTKGTTLVEAAFVLEGITSDEFSRLVRPLEMTCPTGI